MYQLKITLNGITPPIWRRLLVSEHISFYKFHRILQITMGWTNSHLYYFGADEAKIGDIYLWEDDETQSDQLITIHRVLNPDNPKIPSRSSAYLRDRAIKQFIVILLAVLFMFTTSSTVFSQSSAVNQELGVTTGAFTNFPANQNYLKENIGVFYVAPYIRTGQHEFSIGVVCPISTHGLYFTEDNINPRLGAIAGYKFYIFDIYGRENLFVHYAFQYLRFMGSYDKYYTGNTSQPVHWTETNTYINNVVGLGYSLFFDSNERFGFYYTLDYVISQAGYKVGTKNSIPNVWITQFVWNNISTNMGFSFKLTSLKKKDKSRK